MSRGRQWYVGQLKPNGLAIAERNLARQGIETFCPWQIQTLRRSGRLVDVKRPLFPGYIFLRFDPEAGLWRSVHATRGMTRLVQMNPGAPTPLPKALIENLQARCGPDGKLGQAPNLVSGDAVCVISGPFTEFVARIESIAPDTRIRVLFEAMNREVRVDLDPDQVRKTR